MCSFRDKKFPTNFIGYFFTNFFDKKIILNGHLEVYAYGESKFFLKFQKKFEIGP